jgi:hypothetical protein
VKNDNAQILALPGRICFVLLFLCILSSSIFVHSVVGGPLQGTTSEVQREDVNMVFRFPILLKYIPN